MITNRRREMTLNRNLVALRSTESMKRLLFFAVWMCGTALGQVEIESTTDRAIVRINGQMFTELHFGEKAHKPYLHPLRTASGKAVTRGFPVDPQPGEMTNSPHQLGLWVGHEKLNGVDFFEVDPVMQISKKRKVGTVVFKDLTATTSGQKQGTLAFRSDWVDPDGKVNVIENRTLTFYAEPANLRIVDVDFRLKFPEKSVISDHADGVLGMRLGKAFEERNGGVVRNFSGAVGADNLYGRRSPWIDYSATLDGERVGVAIFDHPDNYNFPTRWKIRTFASIFASAFGEQEFYHENPWKTEIPRTAKDAGLTLEAGDELRFRFRVVIHPDGLNVEEAWRKFAQTK